MLMGGIGRGNGSKVSSNTSQPISTIVATASSKYSLSIQITSLKLKSCNVLQRSLFSNGDSRERKV